jgi:predicted nucleic acid-binding protein
MLLLKKVYAYVYIKPLQNHAALLVFLSNIEIMPFEILAVKTYEKMRYDMNHQRGNYMDKRSVCEAHARSLGYVLISDNTGEFAGIDRVLAGKWA